MFTRSRGSRQRNATLTARSAVTVVTMEGRAARCLERAGDAARPGPARAARQPRRALVVGYLDLHAIAGGALMNGLDRIVEAAKLLYGDRWQMPLATASGVSQPHLEHDLRRAGPAPGYGKKIAQALIAEIKRVRRKTDRVERIAAAMTADLEKKYV